jgi:hypothetical protein
VSLHGLLKSPLVEEILLPIGRAIEYLISGDRAIIEKLSSEVRQIVEEIVAEYEKKYPRHTKGAPVPR